MTTGGALAIRATNLLNIQSPSSQGTSLTVRNTASGWPGWQFLATGPGNLGGAGNLQLTSPGLDTIGIVPLTVNRFGMVGISNPNPVRILEIGGDNAFADGLARFSSKDRTGSAYRS